MSRSWANGRTIRELFAAVVAEHGDRCWLCGLPGADTIDHLEPRTAGGTHTLDNLAPAHRSCNSRRGARRGVRSLEQPRSSSRSW